MAKVHTEEEQAYQILGKRFGFSPAYIRSVLEEHFESPSDAGWEHMSREQNVSHEQERTRTLSLTLEEVRDSMYLIDRLRAEGHLPPLKRYIEMDWVKKNKRGKYYVATKEQLQEELRMQELSSIDPDGNLVVNGQIVQHRWLQSQADT